MADDPGAMYALTSRDWKFIHEPEVGPQLFDSSADPHELQNLVAVRPEEAREVAELHGVRFVVFRSSASAAAARLAADPAGGKAGLARRAMVVDQGFADIEQGVAGDAVSGEPLGMQAELVAVIGVAWATYTNRGFGEPVQLDRQVK